MNLVRSVLALGLTLVLLQSCAGGDPCSRTSPCPNDTPPTQAQRTQCRAEVDANRSAACFNESLALQNCFLDATTCGGNGTTDGNATLTKFTNTCSRQIGDVNACCARTPTSTVCQSSDG